MIARNRAEQVVEVQPRRQMRVCGTQASGLHDSEPTPHYDARDLVRSGNTALVELDGQLYTLRITRSGKLILTK